MGVKDLWQLLSPIGRRVSIETLEGKTLAIDVSIWVTQFIKAMRDEDGRMTKNAHLIGTLRRILKLLFHRIRPLFVFDGATPALKLRTVKARRKSQENNENNKRSAAQRILLAQLKQHAINTAMEDHSLSKKEESTATGFAKNFNPYPVSLNDVNVDNVAGHASANRIEEGEKAEEEDESGEGSDMEDVRWESGYEGLHTKKLAAGEEDEELFAREDQEEAMWRLPEDHSEMDVEALSAMPAHIRKSLIETARKKERVKSRATYLPVASNPALYSQTQLANFLNTSKLNTTFARVQQAVDSKSKGTSIAADGGKKYTLTAKPSLATADSVGLSATEETGFFLNISSSEEEDEEGGAVDGDETEWAEDMDSWMQSVASSAVETTKVDTTDSSGERTELTNVTVVSGSAPATESGRADRCNGGGGIGSSVASGDNGKVDGAVKRRVRILEEEEAVGEEMTASPVRTVPTTSTSATLSTSTATFTSETIPISCGSSGSSGGGSGSGSGSGDSGSNVSDRSCVVVAEEQEIVPHFYGNLHCDPDDEEDEGGNEEQGDGEGRVADGADDFDDVDWQSEEEDEELEEIQGESGAVEMGQKNVSSDEAVGGMPIQRQSPLHPALHEASEDDFAVQFVSRKDTHQNYRAVESVSSVGGFDSEALSRAVDTASSMADWAGRAVRSALKQHMQQGVVSNSSTSSDNTRSIVAFTAPVMTHQAASPVHVQFSLPVDYDHPNLNTTISDASTTSNNNNNNNNNNNRPSDSNDIAVQTRSLLDLTSEDAAEWLQAERAEEQSARRAMASSMRDSEGLTAEMTEQVMQLVRAFDLPYIVAPFEAEAQCCVLEQLGLVDGVVTEDSDAFLFGSQVVYRHIFNDKKYVEVYRAEDVERELGLYREDLVAFAYFLGSDYTPGVNGVGIVNAVEIIQAFSMRADTGGPVAGLRRFREWLEGFDFVSSVRSRFDAAGGTGGKRKRGNDEDDETAQTDEEVGEAAVESKESTAEAKLLAFQAKHQSGRSKWSVPASFPDEKVVAAYMQPQASRDTERFQWRVPDLGKIRHFCGSQLGWTKSEMDASIDPVIAKYCERSVQTRIDSHFLAFQDNSRFAKIASERLRTAVVQITGKKTDLSLSGPSRRPSQSKKEKKNK